MDASDGRERGDDPAELAELARQTQPAELARQTQSAALVERARRGDDEAFGELYDLWFDRVHDLSCRVAGDRSVGAEVAQETFLRAWRSLDTVRDPQVFGGWLLRIARNTALNRRRAEGRTSAVDAEGLAMIENHGASPAGAPAGFRAEAPGTAGDDPADAVAGAEAVVLVRDAVAALTGRDAEVLDLGLRLGLSPAEIGEAIGLNRNAANQAVHRARNRLRIACEARVLWRGNRPDCPDLARALAAAGVEQFGSAAVPVAESHAKSCARCADRRRLRLDPAALFGATPLLAAPVLLKAKVAAALAAEGVPMGGSAHAGVGGGGGGTPTGGTGEGSAASSGEVTVPDLPVVPMSAPPPTSPVVAIASGPPEDTSSSGRKRVLALVLVLLLVVLVGARVTMARSGDDDGDLVASADAEPSTTTVPATTSSTTTASTVAPTTVPATVPETTAPPTTRRPVVVPPPPPPSTTTTTVPVAATLTITPSTRAGLTWIMPDQASRLTWSSSGAASVTVTGPNVSSASPSGDAPICPVAGGSPTLCVATAGIYTYVLTARDAAGNVVAERTATLTVT